MTRKDDRIKELEVEVEKQRDLADTLKRSIEISAGFDKARADFHRREKEVAERQAKLRNIREGLIPVEDLRALVSTVHHERRTHDQGITRIELRAFGSRTAIEQAVIDALTKEKPVYADDGITFNRGLVESLSTGGLIGGVL